MIFKTHIALLGLLICSACQLPPSQAQEETSTSQVAEEEPSPTKHPLAQQLLIVSTSGWDQVAGDLRRFEYQSGAWVEIGEGIPIVVGKKGMAWGPGIPEMNRLNPKEGPIKKEGDLKSPAGLFRLETAFGYASKEETKWIKSPYLSIKNYTQCIEDIQSDYYNQIVADTVNNSDWNSTDKMLRKDDLYEWGMVIAYNTDSRTPGLGSCIFLHVGNPKGRGTAGCTAMEKNQIRKLLTWIDPQQQPLLVQMPDFAYPDFQEYFDLPNK